MSCVHSPGCGAEAAKRWLYEAAQAAQGAAGFDPNAAAGGDAGAAGGQDYYDADYTVVDDDDNK